MRRRFFFLSVGFIVILLTSLSAAPFPSFAQSPIRWSSAQRIPGIADDSDPPYLVADQNRTVHAFFSQWIGSELAVFYNRWTLTNGWTTPVDILLSPDKQQATVLDALLDRKGLFDVIFLGGIAQGAEIYYSSAPAINAGQARAWSPPKLVGIQATSPPSGALAEDDRGDLFLVYSGERDGYGVYATQSTDGGATWSDPVAIFLTRSSVKSTFGLRMYLDESGWLHALWNVVDKFGQSKGIYSARLNIRNKEWSLPISLAETPSGIGANDPAIIQYRGLLFVGFYDADLGGHYVMRTSSDEGKTWADPVAPFPRHIGANGAGSFVVDGSGELHMFWGQRTTDSPQIHGMWHSTLQGDNHWSEPDPIVSGPMTGEFDPSIARAVVSQGNVLLVTWRQDPGLAGNGVWYSYAISGAPELPTLALPTALLVSTSTPEAIITPQSSPSPTLIPKPALVPQNDGIAPSPLNGRPDVAILAAVFPVILLLIAIVVVRSLRASA